jgi:hypothetical protein
VRASGAAHSSQNLAPDEFSCWQREHFMKFTVFVLERTRP